jgi:hypothetical protein
MGLFNYDFDSDGEIRISKQGWVYLSVALPLTVLTLGLSYTWMYWTAKKQQKVPVYSAAVKTLARASDVLRLGAGTRGTRVV